ncbi:hypothetical protein N7470_004967 [Penicillium chermesinum]|nr:hypothetical protein N7470_004967 [Penicillium chermesinum]
MSTTSVEKHVSKAGFLKSRRSRVLLALVLFIIICAAVIPPVVVTELRKKNDMGPKSKVIVPLYVYPAPGAWAPLEKEIAAHPDVNFTVVINPGSGPGPNALPDANYTREIPVLRSYENVRLLGYVHTSYAQRNISLVRRDIETYAAWPDVSSNKLATPQRYSGSAFDYLQNLTDLAKSLDGFGPDPFVVHNPGTVPDSRYMATADSTVVVEAAYDTFLERNGTRQLTEIPSSNRTQRAALIHSVPDSVAGSKLRGLVKQVRGVADEVFITHLSEDYYANFGDRWSEFVDLMDD